MRKSLLVVVTVLLSMNCVAHADTETPALECTKLRRASEIAAASGTGLLLVGEKLVGTLAYAGQEWTLGWFTNTDNMIKHPAFQGTIFRSFATRLDRKDITDCIFKGQSTN